MCVFALYEAQLGFLVVKQVAFLHTQKIDCLICNPCIYFFIFEKCSSEKSKEHGNGQKYPGY